MSRYTELIRHALSKLQDSYAPYSGYHVAAALRAADRNPYFWNIEYCDCGYKRKV
mgnify:CR=1 FL=1